MTAKISARLYGAESRLLALNERTSAAPTRCSCRQGKNTALRRDSVTKHERRRDSVANAARAEGESDEGDSISLIGE